MKQRHWIAVSVFMLLLAFYSNLIKIRTLEIYNSALIDEVEQIHETNIDLINRYNELHGAYEYLDERYELEIKRVYR